VRTHILMPMPRKLLSVMAAIVTTLVVSLAAAPAAQATSTHVAARSSLQAVSGSFDSQVLYWTNVARQQHGLRPLRAGVCVDKFAERWTARMAARNFFSHQALRPILKRCHRHAAAENIAYGTGSLSPSQVVSMWMHSAGHRHNILNPRYKALGVGTWRSGASGRVYVTQDFAG
jgi:uncharacterized protein YkwD